MAGVNNEMAVVSVFLEAYEDAPPYRYLDKLICRWRRHEFLVRDECGLAPIESNYPGCFPYKRRHLGDGIRRRADKKKSPFQTVHDVILHNDRNLKLGKNVSGLPRLIMDDINWGPPEEKDWDAWIEQESEKLKHDDRAYKSILEDQKKSSAGGKNDYDYAAAHESFRKLLGGDEIEWFNYFPMLGVRTEYYYRYSGSQTIPPCYGNFLPESQKETNHWRVMKDPIRIHPRQLQEMRRLIADRVAPIESKVNACKPDTAAKVKKDGYVEAARPLQSFNNNTHFKVFCQCKDWRSKWPEDRDWCSIDDITERFYDNPYNFKSNGF